MRKWNANNKQWRKDWQKNNRERLNKKQRERNKSPEIILKKKEYFSRWRKNNSEHEKSRWANYYSKNRESILAKRKASTDRESKAARQRAYYAINKDDPSFKKKNQINSKVGKGRRRAIELKAPVGDRKLISKYVASIRSMASVDCYYCKKSVPSKSAHIDHVIPLSKGGSHSVGNLCAACPDCNLRKNAKLPSEFSMMLPL